MKHIIGIVLCSIVSFGMWLIASSLGWSRVFMKEQGWIAKFLNPLVWLFGAPFLWVKPGSVLDGPILLFIASLFWGMFLYSLVIVYRNWRKSKMA